MLNYQRVILLPQILAAAATITALINSIATFLDISSEFHKSGVISPCGSGLWQREGFQPSESTHPDSGCCDPKV